MAEVPGEPRVAAVFFQPPSPEAPTLVYVHGNADQIGWGGAYLGRVMREQHGLGFYGEGHSLDSSPPCVSIILHPPMTKKLNPQHGSVLGRY